MLLQQLLLFPNCPSHLSESWHPINVLSVKIWLLDPSYYLIEGGFLALWLFDVPVVWLFSWSRLQDNKFDQAGKDNCNFDNIVTDSFNCNGTVKFELGNGFLFGFNCVRGNLVVVEGVFFIIASATASAAIFFSRLSKTSVRIVTPHQFLKCKNLSQVHINCLIQLWRPLLITWSACGLCVSLH